eukprot:Plantae.Rhodophyta-Purpureofilum_apyrenoidigerum.ctg14989.p1 GENE.Plantae.Rhodophyta-Purpureofilum_apyrenoidigerum.ctg14989~~Plantae.Rhodophyta-Purpureofilum_apyrenoidigerum.ctg14989.p1  ORF type:complete len:364 (-),score=48.90 Plantae.Rhodophyta-Purpureofilum_apyrenoidigerum.ctg14989:281-1372(-)
MGKTASDWALQVLSLPIFGTLAILYTAGSLVVVDVLLPITKLVLAALGKHKDVMNLCSWTMKHWMRPYSFHIENVGGLHVEVCGDELRPQENAVIICNHRSWMDTMIIFSIARQYDRDGDLKIIAKKSLLFFPVYGLGAVATGVCIFIRRTSTRAQNAFIRTFEHLVDSQAKRPFWIVSYLEGTRLTPSKLTEAQDFAKKRDLNVLRNVLQPRTKGFSMITTGLGENLHAVYDLTIGYESDEHLNTRPSFEEVLTIPSFGRKKTVKVYQRRIDAKQIPRDEEGLRRFVYNLYNEKDQLLESLRKNGKFPDKPIPWRRMSLQHATACYLTVVATGLLILYAIWTGIFGLSYHFVSMSAKTQHVP